MSIDVNLLPWREARREKRTRHFYSSVVLMLVAGTAIALGVMQLYQHKLVVQQQRNAYISQHIERLNNEIADVQSYQRTAERLGEQLALFQTLQAERVSTVQLFNAIAASAVDGVVYQRLTRSGDQVSVSAMAGSERQVSDQLRQLASIPGLGVPLLSEVTSGQDGNSRLFQFEVVQTTLQEVGEQEEAP